jgi:hypothetical protein
MCGFPRSNIALTSFADPTTYFFGRAQLSRLDRRSFVTTYDGTTVRY